VLVPASMATQRLVPHQDVNSRRGRRAPLRQLLRPADAAAALGVSRMTLYRLEARGEIPRRVAITEHAVGWFADDLAAYVAKRQVADSIDPSRFREMGRAGAAARKAQRRQTDERTGRPVV
jgi:predicted DNA-binding transcriptional regulator AlpA